MITHSHWIAAGLVVVCLTQSISIKQNLAQEEGLVLPDNTAGQQIGQYTCATTRQGPATGAVAEVEPYARRAAGAQHWWTVGQHRPRAFPLLGLRPGGGAREPIVQHLIQRAQRSRVQCR